MGTLACLGFVTVLFLASSIESSTADNSQIMAMASSRYQLGRLMQEISGSRDTRDLAATSRVDPLDKLRKYRGGYNISNKHYWSSAVFSGKYGYSFAVLWLLSGIGVAIFVLSTICCGKGKRRKPMTPTCSTHSNLWHIILVVISIAIVIIASGVALGGISRFNGRAKKVKNIIILTAEEASEAMKNVTLAINDIQQNVQIPDSSGLLNSTALGLNRAAADILRQAHKTRRIANKVISILFAVPLVVVLLTLIKAIGMSVFGFTRRRKPFYVLIIFCWILTVLCLLYVGVSVFMEKFAGDTCTAVEQYQQNPRRSSLSSILPCDRVLSARAILNDAKQGVHDFMNEVNANLSATPILNQFRICNPISGPPSYNYHLERCSNNTIQIGDVPQLVRRFVCSVEGANATTTCRPGQFISARDYTTITALANSIQNLINTIPGTERLVDCHMVKEVVSEIVNRHCKPVKRDIHMVLAATLTLSMTMVILVSAWAMNACCEYKTHHFSDSSVKPHDSSPSPTPSETTTSNINVDHWSLDRGHTQHTHATQEA